ncbi:hypothetical protein J4403_02570 [Candidatus Woesearchaeota archaeon]|nr:hypothetical protein [Candidatus Woesearchaeota archaeon]
MKYTESSQKNIIAQDKFFIVLSLVSILGFIGIVSETIFNYRLTPYIESIWLLIIGIGLIYETKFSALISLKNGLNQENFPIVVTEVIGVIAVLSGAFSFPPIKIDTPGFFAIKGIVSIIAIVIIFIQTWIAKE